MSPYLHCTRRTMFWNLSILICITHSLLTCTTCSCTVTVTLWHCLYRVHKNCIVIIAMKCVLSQKSDNWHTAGQIFEEIFKTIFLSQHLSHFPSWAMQQLQYQPYLLDAFYYCNTVVFVVSLTQYHYTILLCDCCINWKIQDYTLNSVNCAITRCVNKQQALTQKSGSARSA